MGVEIWVAQDVETGEYYITDLINKFGAGPIEISNELYERIMEHDREHAIIQDILASLDYDWTYPDG